MQYTENPIAKICQLISLSGYFIIRFESIHFTHDIKFQTIIVCHAIIYCFCDVWGLQQGSNQRAEGYGPPVLKLSLKI